MSLLYEELSAQLEAIGRLEAFLGQLQPVIDKPLPEEEAESLRMSMLEHLPQRPLRLGDVRVRLDRGMAERGVTARNKTSPVRFGACTGCGGREGDIPEPGRRGLKRHVNHVQAREPVGTTN